MTLTFSAVSARVVSGAGARVAVHDVRAESTILARHAPALVRF